MVDCYLDSHCHLNDARLKEKESELVDSARSAGVKRLLVIGYDIKSSEDAVEIASKHDGVYAAVGFQPENINGFELNALDRIKELSGSEKVIAIGEIGLDYYWDNSEPTKEKQKIWFRKQLELANELDLPVSIHARDAIGDTLSILKEIDVRRKGVLHCYSGSVESLREFAKLGYYFGFDGPITYKNSLEPKRCVAECPLDRLLSETDSPYLPPVPFRGKENHPEYIPYIVKQMADIRGQDEETIAKAIEENFLRLFHVKP